MRVVDVSGRSVAMTQHAVVIAGGGPTGLMLAGELALAKVDVAIVERRATQDLPGSRAGGPALAHDRGPRSARHRRSVPGGGAGGAGRGIRRTPLDISDFPTRHPYGLGLWQNHIERLLAEWVDELGVADPSP
jgi:3-(3-hydroxy-phenyl)propionate hydroxylase